jgi:dienelactone hydrolase
MINRMLIAALRAGGLRRRNTRLLALILLLLLIITLVATARDADRGFAWVDANGIDIKVYTYRPKDCPEPAILFVFHGLYRNAAGVRDKAREVADAACLMVVAPLFDRDRFPNWRYHRAGVVRGGQVQPREQWTAPIVQALVDWARTQTPHPDPKVYLFGHSAGGQFLSRLSAYSPIAGADRIVIANPSVYVAPLLNEAAPYGFEGVFPDEEAEEHLRAYLALPITVYLGQQDTGEKYLVTDEAALRQGENRLDRGRTIFRLAQDVAREQDWPFNWRLVEVPEVGHSSGNMLHAEAFREALGLNADALSRSSRYAGT